MAAPTPESPLLLRVRLETPHGAPVHGATITIAGPYRFQAREGENGEYVLPLDGEGDRQITIARYGRPEGFDHRTLRATLSYRSPRLGAPADLHLFGGGDPEVHGVRVIGPTEDGFALRARLDYLWFTPIGYPPREGNTVRVLIDGEEAWGNVADAFDAARASIHVTTWIYQPTAELRRPDPLADPEAREPHTVQDILEHKAATGTVVRLLVWDAPFIDIPRAARRAEREASDNFEVLQEENQARGGLLRADEYPMLSGILGQHPLFSFHQKTIVVDDRVGFCGGMNMKENDWDRPSHLIFDPHRAHFERPSGLRARIAEAFAEADNPPRHDFIARVEGPAVADLAANFAERWEHTRGAGVAFAQNATAVPTALVPPEVGRTPVQVIRTMPAPYGVGGNGERGILDVYVRAIGAARRLIYIEDQYFRSTIVSDAVADALRNWPDLALIVVTLRSYANDPLQGGWCWDSFRRIAERREGVELYTLIVRQVDHEDDTHEKEVDIHAKLMIVDDLFLTVGSCNINDRGFEIEGEINLAIEDPEIARDTRLRLWREHLADDPALTGDITQDLKVWRRHAEQNRDTGGEVYPISNVVPFTPKRREPWFDKDVW